MVRPPFIPTSLVWSYSLYPSPTVTVYDIGLSLYNTYKNDALMRTFTPTTIASMFAKHRLSALLANIN